MIQQLLSAIQTFVNTAAPSGSGLKAGSITGGLYLHEAAPQTAMPYAVAMLISAPTQSKYGGVAFGEAEIQFTVFAADANSALAAASALVTAFDEQIFTLSGGAQHFNTTRLGEPIPSPGSPDQDESGRDVFGWIVSYRFAASSNVVAMLSAVVNENAQTITFTFTAAPTSFGDPNSIQVGSSAFTAGSISGNSITYSTPSGPAIAKGDTYTIFPSAGLSFGGATLSTKYLTGITT